MTPILPPARSLEDDRTMTLICAVATAIVAVAAGKEGKDSYQQLKVLIRNLSK